MIKKIRYLFVITLITFCGCNVMPMCDMVISKSDDCFANVNVTLIEDKYVLLIKIHQNTHVKYANASRSDFGVMSIPAIIINQEKPSEFSMMVGKDEKNGVIVYGYANADDDDVYINCTLNVLVNGEVRRGFKDLSFELNSTQRIPLPILSQNL